MIQRAASIERIAIMRQNLQPKQANADVINNSGLSHLVGCVCQSATENLTRTNMVVSQSKEPYVNTHTCHAIEANSSLEKQCNVHPLPFSDARLKGITAQRNFGAYRSSNSTRRAAHSVPRTWPGRGSGGKTRKQGDAMNEGHFFFLSTGLHVTSIQSPQEVP